jgi:YD repeat-containing protein
MRPSNKGTPRRCAVGLPASITEPSSGAAYLSGLTFNVAGQLTGDALGDGVVETYGYDPNRLQLTSQTATLNYPTYSTTLMNLNYSYQAAAGQMGPGTVAGNAGQFMAVNNSSQILGSPETAAYTYDLNDRLATSSETTNATTYDRQFSYDAWGNRTSEYDAVSGGTQIQSLTLVQSVGGAEPIRASPPSDQKEPC